MNDLVIAVYFKECYAGEAVLKLVKVFCAGEPIPEEYAGSDSYIIKSMQLCELK